MLKAVALFASTFLIKACGSLGRIKPECTLSLSEKKTRFSVSVVQLRFTVKQTLLLCNSIISGIAIAAKTFENNSFGQTTKASCLNF